ncbi:hypothetical protein FSP39_006975 [Pinctada imbricata]|uniref:Uncharacterized protein n=1 Tax=Pinctada imbricata TaxID=66713 RepID=A0AA88Y339_PINIB|nr:hypothetical protein FSP39_006975 [Pinctada imbricata]
MEQVQSRLTIGASSTTIAWMMHLRMLTTMHGTEAASDLYFTLDKPGIVDYCKRYAQGAYNVQQETFKPVPVMYDVETAEKIQKEYQASLPLDKIPERRKWRDARLAGLAKLKKEAEEKKTSS